MSHSIVQNTFAYPFTAKELARLDMYRAAIDAGLYTDQIGGPTPIESTNVTLRSNAIDRIGRGGAWLPGDEANGME